MPKYASGKRALAISDRSGLQYPWREMVTEWNGAFVHISEYEPKQPQLEPKPISADAVSLLKVRPSRTAPAVARIMPDNPFETYEAASSIINVTFPDAELFNLQTHKVLMVLQELKLQKQQATQLQLVFLEMAQEFNLIMQKQIFFILQLKQIRLH